MTLLFQTRLSFFPPLPKFRRAPAPTHQGSLPIYFGLLPPSVSITVRTDFQVHAKESTAVSRERRRKEGSSQLPTCHSVIATDRPWRHVVGSLPPCHFFVLVLAALDGHSDSVPPKEDRRCEESPPRLQGFPLFPACQFSFFIFFFYFSIIFSSPFSLSLISKAGSPFLLAAVPRPKQTQYLSSSPFRRHHRWMGLSGLVWPGLVWSAPHHHQSTTDSLTSHPRHRLAAH